VAVSLYESVRAVTAASGEGPVDWAAVAEAARAATDPGDVDQPPYLPDAPGTRRALARHYDNIERADEQVGDILDRLEADGVTDPGGRVDRFSRRRFEADLRDELERRYREFAATGIPGR
jgi:uncharacterized protein (DUF2342 family)